MKAFSTLSLLGLQKQSHCGKNNLQIIWFGEDMADVTEYLNTTLYLFRSK